MSLVTYSFKTYLNSFTNTSEKCLFTHVYNESKLTLNFRYTLLNESKENYFKITEETSHKLVSKNRFIGKIKFEVYLDMEVLAIPLMIELFDLLIEIHMPDIDHVDFLISGYLDLEKQFDENTIRGSISENEGYITSQGSPEIYASVVSSNFKFKKTHNLPITWGIEAKFFPEPRTKSIFFKDYYILFENKDPSKVFYGVSNIKYILANIELFKGLDNYKIIVDNYDPYNDGSGLLLYQFENIENNKLLDSGDFHYDLQINGELNISNENGKFGYYLDYHNKPSSVYTKTQEKVKRNNLQEITVTFWINVYNHTGNWLNIFHLTPDDNDSSGNSRQPAIWLHKNDNRKFHVRNDGVSNGNLGIEQSNGMVNYGEWHFVAIRVYDRKIDLFIDGELTDTYNSSQDFKYNDGYIYIGDRWYNKNYKIDQVRVFLRKLEDYEIKQIMNEKLLPEIYNPDLSWLRVIFKNNALLNTVEEDTLLNIIYSSDYDKLLFNYREVYNKFKPMTNDLNIFDCSGVKYLILYGVGDKYNYKAIYY